MKYKVGDKVKVVTIDNTWPYWMPNMNHIEGNDYIIVGTYRFSDGITHPTIIIEDGGTGLNGENEYGIPEHCLELVEKQLMFDFMYD